MGPEFENKIDPISQPHVLVKIEEITNACSNHYSLMYQQMKNEIQLNVNQSRDKLNSIVEEVERERNEFY